MLRTKHSDMKQLSVLYLKSLYTTIVYETGISLKGVFTLKLTNVFFNIDIKEHLKILKFGNQQCKT